MLSPSPTLSVERSRWIFAWWIWWNDGVTDEGVEGMAFSWPTTYLLTWCTIYPTNKHHLALTFCTSSCDMIYQYRSRIESFESDIRSYRVRWISKAAVRPPQYGILSSRFRLSSIPTKSRVHISKQSPSISVSKKEPICPAEDSGNPSVLGSIFPKAVDLSILKYPIFGHLSLPPTGPSIWDR